MLGSPAVRGGSPSSHADRLSSCSGVAAEPLDATAAPCEPPPQPPMHAPNRLTLSAALVAALLPLHLVWSRQALRAGLTFESVRRLRRRYRWLYAVVGVLMLVATVAR